MTIVSRVNRGIAIACWVLLVVLGVSVALSAPLAGQVAVAIIAVGGAAIVWQSLWRPHLLVDAQSVTVANPLRTITIPWNALIHVDTKYALTLFTPGRKTSVWCAPQPGALSGRRHLKRVRDDPNATRQLDEGVRIGDVPGTESGDAAKVVRDEWQRQIDAGAVEPGTAEATPIVTRVSPVIPVALGLTVLLSLTVPLLVQG